MRSRHCTQSLTESPLAIIFLLTDPATTAISTLSLHDALPIFTHDPHEVGEEGLWLLPREEADVQCGDRKSTRLNSSHTVISYAVFCLKKKRDRRGPRRERGRPSSDTPGRRPYPRRSLRSTARR